MSKRYSKRNGYSRVLKAGFRTGDDAPMALIKLIDRNIEAKKVDKPKKVKDKDKETTKETKLNQIQKSKANRNKWIKSLKLKKIFKIHV